MNVNCGVLPSLTVINNHNIETFKDRFPLVKVVIKNSVDDEVKQVLAPRSSCRDITIETCLDPGVWLFGGVAMGGGALHGRAALPVPTRAVPAVSPLAWRAVENDARMVNVTGSSQPRSCCARGRSLL